MRQMEKLDQDKALTLAIDALMELPAYRLWAVAPELVTQVVSVAGMLEQEEQVNRAAIARAAGIFRMGDFQAVEDFVLVALWRKHVLGGVADATPAHPDQDLRGGIGYRG